MSTIHRKAILKLDETGDLEGKVTVTYTGLEASQRRIEERLADDTARKRFLEDEVKEAIPVACDVELTGQPDWKSSSSDLVAEFTVKVGGWISGAGRRALMPVGLFLVYPPVPQRFNPSEPRTSSLREALEFSPEVHRVGEVQSRE